MGAQSGATEQDAGTLYPTVMEDSNGNQINIRYNVAAGSYSPSSRIAWIQDARVGYMTAYNFTYNSDSIPHLTGISNNVGTSESYTLTTWGEAVVDPFTGTQFGSPALLAQVMVNGLNVATQFTYWYGTGELTGAITPLGGQLAWGYRSYNYASSNRTYREVDERLMSAAIPSGYQSWSINLDSSPTWHATATVVDNGANTQKTWNFSTAADYTAGLAVTYQEKDTTGTLLEKDYTWAQNPAGAPYVGTLVTKLNPNTSYAAQTQTVQTQDQYGNLLSSTVSDYAGSSTGTRRYVYSYLYQQPGSYASSYIFNRLATATVFPASGGSVVLVYNAYDSGTSYCPSMIATNATNAHDPAYNTSVFYRGNVTLSYGLNFSDAVCSSYDSAGVPYYTRDATGNSVSIQTNPDSSYSLPGVITPNGNSGLASSATYASSWGVTSMTGPSGAQGTTTYDTYGRPSQTTIPDGATTTYTYTNYVAQTNTQATQTATVDGRWKTTTVDGFGRTTRVQTGNGGSIVSTVDTQYAPCACSPLGKMWRVSQPYGTGATPVWTTYTYDGSGRPLTVTAPDGSVTRYAYQGNSTTVTDPAGKWKTSTVDAFGNVILVTEPNPAGGANLATNYTYTPANQLATVSMTRGGVAQTRTFVYNEWDLVSATNPENGTVTYTYDNAHHVTNRTDALGQQTQYTYDSYGRLTEVQYFVLDMWHNLNEDTTQRVTYSYDNANQFTQNGMGRLSQVSFGGGVMDDFNDSYYYLYSYNTAGRVTSQQMAVQTLVNGWHGPQLNTWVTFTANYQWDNEGRMTSLQYPTVSLPDNPPWETSFSLQTAAYQYDINGRMTGMTWDSGNGPQPYASATYGPAGQMLTLSYGAGTETRQYNSLLQLTSQSVPGYLNMTYNYPAGQNNGRIVGSVDGVTGESTTYTYDALNRLSSATASGMWSESYSYDGFGNLTGKSGTGGAPSMGANYNAQNQQVGGGAAYDANGNQTTANNTINGFTVENRIKNQTSTVWPYPIAEYAYDPHGRRVMKRTDPDPDNLDTGSSPSWQYNFYGITGQRLVTMGCTNPSGNPPQPTCLVQGENVYFGRKLLVSNGVTVVTDRLGSVRANTQGERFAYYPYGEERTAPEVDGREKFGTYFRDGVGQDYAMARYYGSGTGRFWSPDPYVATNGGNDPADPQSWNRYAYVQGDPVNNLDPTGRYLVAGGMAPVGDSGFYGNGDGADTGEDGEGGANYTFVGEAVSTTVASTSGSVGGGNGGTTFATAQNAFQRAAKSIAKKKKFKKPCNQDFAALGTNSAAIQADAANLNIQNGVGSTVLEASLWAAGATAAAAAAQYGSQTIGQYIAQNPGTVAEAQMNGNTIYINSSLISASNFFQNLGVVLHEILHNVTGLDDPDIETKLGLPTSPVSDIITKKLIKDCF